MYTAATLPPGEGSGRKCNKAKRRSPGNFFDKMSGFENGEAKLGFVDGEISASPDKNKRGSKNYVREKCPLGSGTRDSIGSSSQSDFSSGKKMGTRRKNVGLREKSNTDGNLGRKLLMGNVTILKRGEKIEDVVVNKSSDEEDDIGVTNKENYEKEGVFVREEKKAVEKCSLRGKGYQKPVKKAMVVARVSQVCPVVSFSDMNLRDAEIEKDVKGKEQEFVNRLGPDPTVLSKEVVLSGSRSSETSSDNDVEEIEISKRSLETDCNVKSPRTPLAIPKMSYSFDRGTTEPVEYSNGGFLFEKWAGPAYANSPSPTCLPLPKFFIRQKVRPNTPEGAIDNTKRSEIPGSPVIQEKDVQTAASPVERSNVSIFSHGGFDVFATRNLRRLLQLE